MASLEILTVIKRILKGLSATNIRNVLMNGLKQCIFHPLINDLVNYLNVSVQVLKADLLAEVQISQFFIFILRIFHPSVIDSRRWLSNGHPTHVYPKNTLPEDIETERKEIQWKSAYLLSRSANLEDRCIAHVF